jgi:cytochrome b subunit of formate dehydrogenase
LERMKSALRTAGRRLVLPAALAALLPLAAAAAEADCAQCHEQSKKITASVHNAAGCVSCHERHETYPHPANVPKPACATCHEQVAGEHAKGVHGQELAKGNAAAPSCGMCHGDVHEVVKTTALEFRTKVPETCGMCHGEVAGQFKTSVHGKALAEGIPEAPLCNDCHGEHNIIRPGDERSPVNPANIRETCGSCHGDVRLTRKFGLPADRILSFDQSFHGLAAKAGSQTVANCASCHGIHNILPSSNPKSTIHPQNLAKTCGNCHPGAGQRFAISQIHTVEGRSEPRGVTYVRQFYLLIIPLTLGLMLLHNAGDWIRKVIRLRGSPAPRLIPQTPGEIRMLPFERAQHALLVISFAVLVWTGFALKYPDHWWARPLLVTEHLRGIAHRTAGVVLIVVSAAHIISLLASKRLREHWKELMPNQRDVGEAVAHLGYNLGLRARKPGRSSHSYVEKAEYWAVVWGTAVMAFTGVMLWANNWMLAMLPKSWLDVATSAHFYEALLATLAILIWHFYSVIFDPDVYPMDTAWLTGRTVRRQESSEEESPVESSSVSDQ